MKHIATDVMEIIPGSVLERKTALLENARTTDTPEYITINELLNNIKDGIYTEQVYQARELLKKDRSLYDKYKKTNVTGFTLSACCKHRKSDSKANGTDKLIYHTGILQIDIDKIPGRLPEIKNLIQNDKYTLFCFTSLSGEGIKAGILIDGNKHKESFLQAEKYYKETYSLDIDKSVKDIYRLCFISSDSDLFINPNAEVFTIQEQKPEPVKQDSAKLQKLKLHPNGTNGINTDRFAKYGRQGIEKAKLIINESVKGDRHNSRCRAGYLLGGYVSGNFFSMEYAMNEIESTVSRNTDLPIDKAMKDIADGINAGLSEPITFDKLDQGRKDYLQQKYGNSWYQMESGSLQIVDKNTGEVTTIKHCFWYEVEGKKNEILLKIEYTKLYDYLKSIGIRKLIVDDKDLKRVLVRVTDNVVSEIDIAGIHKLINKFVDSLPDKISENKTKKDLHELLGKGINVYINDDRINYYIPFERIEFLQDTENQGFFFFKNGFAEVTRNNIVIKPYKELSGFIWKSQIIDHSLEVIPDKDINKIQSFDFVKFTQNICSIKEPEKKLDTGRYKALVCTIGYLLHNYKNTANTFAVILTEANVSDDSQGRTGKGLLMQSIGKLRQVKAIDGKCFSFDSQFAFQTVTLDTQVLHFNDVQKHFNFQRLFSAITEGLSFERKHQDRIDLSPEKSPKIVISSNYAIQGNSESDKGRKYEMELLCYYSSKFRPVNEFGKPFFYSWNSEQWNLFYNYMLSCVQTFFENNNTIPAYSSATIDEKKLLIATSKEFIEYTDTIDRNTNIPCSEFYEGYLHFAGIEKTDKDKPTNKTIGKWLRIYCDYKNIRLPDKSVVKINGKTTKCYNLVTK
jgi:hypothetical protein